MWFTESHLEKIMVKRPGGQRGIPPPVPPVACRGCSYWKGQPCVGVCLKEIMEEKRK